MSETAGADAARTAACDFWELYERWYDEISAETENVLRRDPAIASIIDQHPQTDEQKGASRELLRRALVDGDWAPHLESLRVQGAMYATLGVSFEVWMQAVSAFRAAIVPRLVDSLLGEPDRLVGVLGAVDRFIDTALGEIGSTYLDTKERIIAEQQRAIGELSTPVLPLAEGFLVLPLIGLIDTQRARDVAEHLLNAIRDWRARVVIIDVTGVPAVDTAVANHLLQTAQACRLMGATPILSGISPSNAQTLVQLGVEMADLMIVGDLRRAIEQASLLLGRDLVTRAAE